MGLPAGGVTLSVATAGWHHPGRLVPVRFRFPPDDLSGVAGPEVASAWVVVAGRRRVALIGLQEVHAHFTLSTDDTFMYFHSRI